MSGRAHYKPGVISVTELLHHWAKLYPKLWPNNPPEPSGYYMKRGNWLDQCCAILAQGRELDDRTMAQAHNRREKPLAVRDESRIEQWWDYLWPFRDWWANSGLVYAAHQGYVYNEAEGLQGTYDLKAKAARGKQVRIDFKSGDCPEGVRYQLALYDICEGERCERMVVQLQPGRCTAHLYADYRDYDTARLMIRFYQRMLEYK